MKAVLALAVVLAVAGAASASPCVHQVGFSDMLGTKCSGSYVDQLSMRAGDITKMNLYFDGNCVTGVKVIGRAPGCQNGRSSSSRPSAVE